MDMNEEQYADIKAKLAENEKEHESYNRRLSEHDNDIRELSKTQIILERLTNAVTNLSTGMGEIKTTVQSVDRRVAALEMEPGERWKKIVWEVLKWAVIGAAGIAIGKMTK